MCFSATGSFVASGVLTVIGMVAFSRNASTRHRMYAAIPLLFAAQQAAEGVVWLTLHQQNPAWLQTVAVNTFLVIALVIWPVWMPGSLLRVERKPARRVALLVLLGVGVAVAASAAMVLVEWKPVAQVAGHSIRYAYPANSGLVRPFVLLATYCIPTVLPFFVSSSRLARITGVGLTVSLIAAVLIELNALTSVWCFFAAILSGLVLATIILEQRLLHRPIPLAGQNWNQSTQP